MRLFYRYVSSAQTSRHHLHSAVGASLYCIYVNIRTAPQRKANWQQQSSQTLIMFYSIFFYLVPLEAPFSEYYVTPLYKMSPFPLIMSHSICELRHTICVPCHTLCEPCHKIFFIWYCWRPVFMSIMSCPLYNMSPFTLFMSTMCMI